MALALDLGDVEDADEERDPFALCGSKNVGNLVAVGTIESDDFVTADLGKVASYLRG